MALQTAKGALVLLDAHLNTAQLFWNGQPVVGVTSIRVDWENDEQRVKIKVSAGDAAQIAALRTAGLMVKEV